jgi:hypothetical protein
MNNSADAMLKTINKIAKIVNDLLFLLLLQEVLVQKG